MIRFVVGLICLLTLSTSCAQGQAGPQEDQVRRVVHGFVIEDPSIPPAEIHVGTRGRDVIPAIDEPRYTAGTEADFMIDEELVMGLQIGGEARAYPFSILNWHELVNDVVGEQPVVVSYCPLCRSGYVFSRVVGDSTLTFGVSGLLYNSNVLLYDRETESLWSQIEAEAVSGPLQGAELEQMYATTTTWADWLRTHPDTEVLNRNTGYRRDYTRSPYGDYSRDRALMFPVDATDSAFHFKAIVAGIEVGGKYKAYPIPVLEKAGTDTFTDTFNGQELVISYDDATGAVTVKTAAGEPVIVNQLYWFAWYAHHPETEVYR